MQTEASAVKSRPPFAQLLKGWRQHRNCSQLDLAIASDVSQRHVSFLELGRSTPSRDMVLRLGEALDVPLRDRNTLLSAAGFSAQYCQTGLDDPDMAPVRQALKLMLEHHNPNPAIVVDRDWNVLLRNEAIHRVFGFVGDVEAMWQRCCGDGPHNVFRATLHPEGLRPFILNWDVAASAMIARTRREAAANQSPVLLAMLEEFERDPSIPPEWHASAWIAESAQPVIPLEIGQGSLRLSLFSLISTFGTPHDVTTDEIRVESFFPADEPSRQLLEALANQAPPIPK